MQQNESLEGTIILKATEDALDMFVSSGLTKEEVMGLLFEALSALDDNETPLDEPLPSGSLGVGQLQ
jgi:hypothetical protein